VCGGTLSNFTVTISGSPGGGNSYAFTLMVNGSATGISCTINQPNTSCTDATAPTSLVLAPGDTVNVQAVPAGPPTARSATVTTSYARAGPVL
jgi:hypothetical protein